jgi:hypothetical protein
MAKSNSISFLFLTVLVFSALAGATDDFSLNLNKGTGQITFHGLVNPGAWELHGNGPKPTGQFVIRNGILTETATITLADFKTGIPLRDRHMKEKYLEITKYPTARLDIVDMKFPKELLSGDGKVEKVPFTGQLSLHGKKNSITEGLSKTTRSGDNISAVTTFKVSNPVLQV